MPAHAAPRDPRSVRHSLWAAAVTAVLLTLLVGLGLTQPLQGLLAFSPTAYAAGEQPLPEPMLQPLELSPQPQPALNSAVFTLDDNQHLRCADGLDQVELWFGAKRTTERYSWLSVLEENGRPESVVVQLSFKERLQGLILEPAWPGTAQAITWAVPPAAVASKRIGPGSPLVRTNGQLAGHQLLQVYACLQPYAGRN